MHKNYSILLMGQFYDSHTFRFVRNLKRVNHEIQIDYFTPKYKGKEVPSDYLDCFRTVNIVEFNRFFKYLPLINYKEIVWNWKRYFRAFIKEKHYDVVNIHYPRRINSYILPEIRRVADNIVLSPWGSDVLRINEKERKIVKKLYDAADYVTSGHGRFSDEVKNIYGIPEKKIIDICFGSETIDYINQNKANIDILEAKRRLGISGCYAISCGYNASPSQRHSQIIKAIGEIKSFLPENLILIFPFTYPKNPDYVKQIKAEVVSMGLNAIYFENYLDTENLFILRQATDMFIHVQTTDANNASLKEYLLLEKNCINGAWMEYSDLETDNYKPYYTVNSIDELGEVIEKAYKKGPINIKEKVINNIASYGWNVVAQKWDRFFMSICK